MSPDHAARRRTRRAFWITLGAMIVSLGVTFCRYERDIRSWVGQQVRAIQAANGPEGIQKDLYRNRIRAGDSLASLEEKYPPSNRVVTGEYITLRYDEGEGIVFIVARGDQLVMAGCGGCWFCDVFFNELTPQEQAWLSPAYDAEQDRRREAIRSAARSVAGFGATFEPWEVPGDEQGP